ncbi:hypothetical protein BUALT_Bualt06G0041600 [Buddleja alternifolia]|uniref:Uncharacterized protein n=1 Tax=Buddleja alternifolia TaxID=168488 RepID=A0AAV6XCS8_9LAMI|nr:hypothetical protein BUALT_Bualt06G0041600 [Buddleja alternifolia]
MTRSRCSRRVAWGRFSYAQAKDNGSYPHMSEFDNLNDFSVPNPSGEQFVLGDSSVSEHAKVPPSLSIVEELELRLGVGQVMKSIGDTYLL